MTFDEFSWELIGIAPRRPDITIDVLTDQSDRTLLWGYTVDRHSHHVFIKDGELRMVVYGSTSKEPFLMERGSLYADKIAPNKRMYPEACDLEFCNALRRQSVDLVFTTFNAEREPKTYYGETFDDLFGAQPTLGR